MAESEYPTRYVAFLDILGFRELVGRLNDDPTQLPLVRNLLRDVHRPPIEEFRETFSGSNLRAQSISDAVAISASEAPEGLAHMFAAVEFLAVKLLKADGFLLRGAITKGRLYQDQEMVFGEGLVRAYQYESTVVRYPRIMLPREIANDVDQYIRKNKFPRIFGGQIRKSKDGPLYLHVLRRFEDIKNLKADDPDREKSLTTVINVRNHIQRRLDQAVDEPAHFEKVHWFADYWNDVFRSVEGVPAIEAPGLETFWVVDGGQF
jgi:hypothetical protein